MVVAGTMLAPIGGVSHLRVVHPMEAMATDPCVLTRIAPLAEIPAAGTDGPQICVLHRPLLAGAEGAAILRRLLAQN